MKKWTRLLTIVLMLGMLLSLSACGSKSADKLVRELVNEDADVILLKNFDSPLDFYRAVEQRRADELMGLVMGNALLQNAGAKEGFLESELLVALDQTVLDQELLDLVTQAAGMDLSWVKDLSLNVTAGRSGELSQSSAVLRLNGTDIIHMDVIMDSASMTEYLAVPELNESYFSVNLAEMLDNSSPFSADEFKELLSGSSFENLGSGADLVNRYLRLVLGNITKLELSDGTVNAGGISCSCSIAKVTIEGEDVRRIGAAVLDEAAGDKVVEDLVYRSMKLSGDFSGSQEDFQAKYQSLIQSAREDLEEIGDEGCILMTVYIDAKGEILGRGIEVQSEGERVLSLSFLTARDGDKLGVDAEVGSYNKYSDWSSETVVTLSGAGTYSSDTGKITGDYLARYHEASDYRGEQSEKDLEICRANVDVTLSKEGVTGEILLTPCDDLLNLALEELDGAPSSVNKLVCSLSLAIVNKSSGNQLDSALILRSDGRDLLTLSLTQKPIEKFDVSLPADVVDMETWESSLGFASISTILNNLREAGVPTSLFNSLLG